MPLRPLTATTRFVSYEIPVMEGHRVMAKRAIREAGKIVHKAAIANAEAGMKSGNFVGMSPRRVSEYGVHDTLHENIHMEEREDSDGFSVYIGTPVPHGSFWETGHYNLFTRSYERNQWLTRALFENMSRVRAALLKSVKKTTSQGSSSRVTRGVSFTGVRTILYRTSKLMGDLNAIIGIPGMDKYRSSMLKSARILGDISAVQKGDVMGRVGRRLLGKGLGQSVYRQIGMGTYKVPRRILRRLGGRKTGRLFDLF